MSPKMAFCLSRAAVALLAVGALGCSSMSASRGDGEASLTQVATFEHQVTGVAATKDGRIFVNFPRWTEDAPVSVAEVMKDGSTRPFPNEEWNAWRNVRKAEVSAGDHFVCVQSVVVDPNGALWVVDPAAPGNGPVVPGGAKLVKIDLASNTVAKTILLDDTIAPASSYLNDIRFSPDAKWGYLSDSGSPGALIVVDLETGQARRLLAKDPSTKPEKGVVVHADGKELRRPDGRTAEFAADGIAITADGKYFYWQSLTGGPLYRLPTEAMQDSKLDDAALAAKIERVGNNGVADGLWTDDRGRMLVSSPQDDSIKRRDLPGGELVTILHDKRLRWPDSFAQSGGTIYVTASRIQDMNYYKPKQGPKLETWLLSFPSNDAVKKP